MLKFKNSTTGKPDSTLCKCTASFHFVLTIASVLVEIYILLTFSLLVGCSTKHFLPNLMRLFCISECLCLELRGKFTFSINMGCFST